MARPTELPGCAECRAVVVRAYKELRAFGTSEEAALRAAYRVLSLRHPDPPGVIAATVSAWLSADLAL